VRIVPPGKVRATEEVTTWSSMTADILALRDHLIAAQVTCVAMEATGDYVRHEGAWVKWEAPGRFG
jgi:transposase